MSQADESYYQILIQKYREGTATEEELKVFFGLLSTTELDALLEAQMSVDVDELLAAERIAVEKPRRKLWWVPLAGAAALLIAVLFAVVFNQQHSVKNDHVVFDKDISPGKNQATLKLASGKTIYLNESKQGIVLAAGGIRYNDGTALPEGLPLADQKLTASTVRGGQYQLTLPDGTKVWLNAASSITFPGSFDGQQKRSVSTSGEVYFEVAKMSVSGQRIPFLVSSAGQELEVLGTHFNINSYTDEVAVRTTLLEGSVRVHDLSGNEVMLKPGQQSQQRSGKEISVLSVNTSSQVAWKDGNFQFEEESLGAILRQVARWYDVEVSYEDPALQNEQFVALSTRYTKVSTLLNKLQQAGKAAFRIEGKRIIVSKK